MADWPPQGAAGVDYFTIGPEHQWAVGIAGAGAAVSTAYYSANLAVFYPFRLPAPALATKMYWQNGATVSGNVDVGIYSTDGTRLVSIGSTAQSGTSAIQTVDITDTLLGAGRYFMGLACDNTTSTFLQTSAVAQSALHRVFGICQQATAFTLPATLTAATWANTTVIQYGALFLRTNL